MMNPEIFLYNTAYSAQLPCLASLSFKRIAENFILLLSCIVQFLYIPHTSACKLPTVCVALIPPPPLSLPLGADFTLELFFNVVLN